MDKARTVVAALAAVALHGCDRPIAHEARATAPKLPAGRMVVLPDSAIVVGRGSPEEQLARYLSADLPAPRTFRFAAPEFEPWAARPNKATLNTMYAMTQILRAYPKTRVRLAGYTDSEGTIEDNRRLAEQRVAQLRQLLLRGGIAPARIETEAHAKEGYLASNEDEAGRARNRRIELTVVAR